MKGAKAKSNAIRRGAKDSYGLTKVEERRGVVIPDDIAADPVQSVIWNWIAPPVNNFTEQFWSSDILAGNQPGSTKRRTI